MTVKQAIADRHSVRVFTPEALTEDEIHELLEAGRNAPSSLNSQPWRFKVITAPDDLAWFGTPEATRKQAWLSKAAAIFICCADLDTYVKDSQSAAFFYRDNNIIQGETMDGIDAYVEREATADEMAKFGACAMNVGIAVSFMMLRATEMGLGTCWIGMFDEDNIKTRFGLPQGMRIVNILAVGHPDEQEVFPRKRKSMEDIIIK